MHHKWLSSQHFRAERIPITAQPVRGKLPMERPLFAKTASTYPQKYDFCVMGLLNFSLPPRRIV